MARLCSLQGRDLLHTIRVLGVEEQGALAVHRYGGSGDGVAKAVVGPTLVDAVVRVPKAVDCQCDVAEVVDGVDP